MINSYADDRDQVTVKKNETDITYTYTSSANDSPLSIIFQASNDKGKKWLKEMKEKTQYNWTQYFLDLGPKLTEEISANNITINLDGLENVWCIKNMFSFFTKLITNFIDLDALKTIYFETTHDTSRKYLIKPSVLVLENENRGIIYSTAEMLNYDAREYQRILNSQGKNWNLTVLKIVKEKVIDTKGSTKIKTI